MQQPTGTLYLCATPIGNLEDITLRTLRVLREADAVWAEDTRRTLGLLNHYDIKKPLVSCHEHNERARAQELIGQLRQGRSIAYCSDAGMPGISDPGAALAAACYEEGLAVTVLPGASAVLMSAVLSGLDCDTFTFLGFLPREKKPRAAVIRRMADCPETMLLYESPVRLPATLQELHDSLGDRPAAVLRELTKLHEQASRGTLSELCGRFREPPKGECVIAVAGAPAQDAPQDADDAALSAALKNLLAEGFSGRDAATAAAAVLGVKKKRAYQMAVELGEGKAAD